MGQGAQVFRENVVKVKICNFSVTALVDTGCHMTVMTPTVLNKIPGLRKCKVYPPDLNLAYSIDGKGVKMLGKIFTKVKIGGKTINLMAHLVDNLGYDLIFGTDFLKKHRAIVDFSTQKLTLKSCIPIKAKDTFKIPKRSEVVFLANLRGQCPDNVMGDISCVQNIVNLGAATAKVLTKTKNNQIPARLMMRYIFIKILN